MDPLCFLMRVHSVTWITLRSVSNNLWKLTILCQKDCIHLSDRSWQAAKCGLFFIVSVMHFFNQLRSKLSHQMTVLLVSLFMSQMRTFWHVLKLIYLYVKEKKVKKFSQKEWKPGTPIFRVYYYIDGISKCRWEW